MRTEFHASDEEVLEARWFDPSQPPESAAAWLEEWVAVWTGRNS